MIFALVVIAGCGNKAPEQRCPSPYIIIGADCCLDMNGNGVCDKNEVVKNEIVLIQGMAVNEKCTGTLNLECIGSNIGVDSVSIKLQSITKDLINVKKISLSGLECSAEFTSSAELRFNDVQEFKIPCKMRYSTIDTDILIVSDVRTVKVKNTGEVYDISAPSEVKNSGHISGAVKL